MIETKLVADWIADARTRTLAAIEDLTDEQLSVPQLSMVNPPLWELGHVAWFQENWVRRHARGEELALRDDLYDSSRVAHTSRWRLPLPNRHETLSRLRSAAEAVVEGLARGEVSEREQYFLLLSTFHEDMHHEALMMTRQTLGYPAPVALLERPPAATMRGDVSIPGGTFAIGATGGEVFFFDNEKWAHRCEVLPFAISRVATTQAEFAAFVDDGGYSHRSLWSDEGWQWRERENTTRPVCWRSDGGGWLRRHFDRWIELEPELPIAHVSWFEAEAYCRWARRRLPSELEWEVAAAGEVGHRVRLLENRRRFPWGNSAPSSEQAHLDCRGSGAIDANALPDGDSPFGCRQMIGNVWEWTCSDFLPYAGFSADPYQDYSRPWFGTNKVLKGGSWATRSRMIHAGFRNFYTPDRRDPFVGFRTCAP